MQTLEMLHTHTHTHTFVVQCLCISCFKHNKTIELKSDFSFLQIFAHKSPFHEKSIEIATAAAAAATALDKNYQQ